MARSKHSDAGNGLEFSHGLVNGLLIAIPLWAIIGIALAMAFKDWPLNETAVAALTIAAICEVLLAHRYMRAYWMRFRRGVAFRREESRHDSGRYDLLPNANPTSDLPLQARRAVVPASLLRQSLALSALVGAYLQYYFLEVNLQIALLPSLTIFLPVAPMT